MSGLTIGSLCSGYGGLDLAVEQAFGARTAWVAEVEKAPSKILVERFPDVPNLGDITAVDWTTVEPVDVITGGTPCQDLSHAGKRAGMTEGTRSNLWVAMREAIAALRPSFVVWENVRGAYSAPADSEMVVRDGLLAPSDGGPTLRALGRVLGDLSDLGFDAEWRGLRAADIGAPHGRFRVFVIARLAESASDGRRQGRTESARLEGRSRVAERGATPADGDSRRREGFGQPTGRERSLADGCPRPGQVATDAGGEALGLGAGLCPSRSDRLGRGRSDDDGLPDDEGPAEDAVATHTHTHTPSDSDEPRLQGRESAELDRLPSGRRLLPTPDASGEKYRLGGNSQQSRSLEAMARRGELR